MHGVLVNCLGGLSLPRKSEVRLTDHPDMTLDVYRGRKTTLQQQNPEEDPVEVRNPPEKGNIRQYNGATLSMPWLLPLASVELYF